MSATPPDSDIPPTAPEPLPDTPVELARRQPARPRRRWLTALKWGVVAAAFAYLVGTGKLSPAQFDFAPGWPFWVVALFATNLLITFLAAWRMHVLLRAVDSPLTLTWSCQVTAISQFFSNFGPGSCGGDVVRAFYLLRDAGRASTGLAVMAIDRFVGLGALLFVGAVVFAWEWRELFGNPQLQPLAAVMGAGFALVAAAILAVSVTLFHGRRAGFAASLLLAAGPLAVAALAQGGVGPFASWPPLVTLGLWATGLAAAAGGVVAACLAEVDRADAGLPRLMRRVPVVGEAFHAFLSALVALHGRPWAIVASFALSLALQALSVVVLWEAGRMLRWETPATLAQVFFAGPVAFMANSLPTPGGGIGVGEAVYEEALALCRTAEGEVVRGGGAVFLMQRFLGFLGCLLYAPVYLFAAPRPRVTEVSPAAVEAGSVPPA